MKETAMVLNFPKEHTLLHVRNIKHGIRSTANKWIIKNQRQNKYATKMYGLLLYAVVCIEIHVMLLLLFNSLVQFKADMMLWFIFQTSFSETAKHCHNSFKFCYGFCNHEKVRQYIMTYSTSVFVTFYLSFSYQKCTPFSILPWMWVLIVGKMPKTA